MNTAIIVAAGSGTRFNSDKPKQFIDLLGKPVLVHTIEKFEQAPSVGAIVVVVGEDHIDLFNEIQSRYGLPKVTAVVSGGMTRARSVVNGLKAVDEATEIVAVHDGARPMVSAGEIERTIQKAGEVGAACLVGPVTDTIKRIDGNAVISTIDRRSLRRAMTPQAFKFATLLAAFDNADLSESVSDECYLVEKLGRPIAAVAGSSQNIKITHEEDLLFVESLLKNQGVES